MRTNYAIGICLLLSMTWSSHASAQVNTTVETFRVPSNGSTVTAKTRFKPRKIYYIIADGRIIDGLFKGTFGDAEYDNINTIPEDVSSSGFDDGIGINSVPVIYGGQGKTTRWGSFNSENRYKLVYWIGKNDSSTVSFNLHDSTYDNNQDDFSDPLRIEIQAPQDGNCYFDLGSQQVVHVDESDGSFVWRISSEGRFLDSSPSRGYVCADSISPTVALVHISSSVGPAFVRDGNRRINDECQTVEFAGYFKTSCFLRVPKRKKITINSGDSRATLTLIPVNPYHR